MDEPSLSSAFGILFDVATLISAMDGTLDHTMMRVEDLEKSLDWYQTYLGYEEKGRLSWPSWESALRSLASWREGRSS